MPFNPQLFIGSLVGDGARPNLFEIIFPAAGPLMTLRAQATSIPGSFVGIAPTYYFGRQVKLAGNRVFTEWQVEVLVDEIDYVTGPRAFMERWSNELNTHEGNMRLPSALTPLSYMRDATVIHYGKAGIPIATYQMRQCWPTEVSPVGLNWGQNDTIETFSVTFALQYWQSINTM